MKTSYAAESEAHEVGLFNRRVRGLGVTLLLATSMAMACSESDAEGQEPNEALTPSAGGASGAEPSVSSPTAGSETVPTAAVPGNASTGSPSATDASGGRDSGMGPMGSPSSSNTQGGTGGHAAGGVSNLGGATNLAGAMNAGGLGNDGDAGSANGGSETGGSGTGGAGAGGAGGGDGSAGAAGEAGDLVAPRPLDVTAAPARHQHTFQASDADPDVSFNDNDQIAVFDNRAATLMGKLVLTFGGAGETRGNLTGGGEFCARRGFHVLAVAAFQDYDIVSYGADFFGEARRTAFEGIMHTRLDAFANIEMTPADGVAQRTQKALQYLHSMYPEEDWGYYLQQDGSVRWSDVIFTGMSHGASNSARFAFLVRASRVVSASGPRDNLCQRNNLNDCGGVIATWFDEEPATPIDRCRRPSFSA